MSNLCNTMIARAAARAGNWHKRGAREGLPKPREARRTCCISRSQRQNSPKAAEAPGGRATLARPMDHFRHSHARADSLRSIEDVAPNKIITVIDN